MPAGAMIRTPVGLLPVGAGLGALRAQRSWRAGRVALRPLPFYALSSGLALALLPVLL